jgi:hypothetical protein
MKMIRWLKPWPYMEKALWMRTDFDCDFVPSCLDGSLCSACAKQMQSDTVLQTTYAVLPPVLDEL